MKKKKFNLPLPKAWFGIQGILWKHQASGIKGSSTNPSLKTRSACDDKALNTIVSTGMVLYKMLQDGVLGSLPIVMKATLVPWQQGKTSITSSWGQKGKPLAWWLFHSWHRQGRKTESFQSKGIGYHFFIFSKMFLNIIVASSFSTNSGSQLKSKTSPVRQSSGNMRQ